MERKMSDDDYFTLDAFIKAVLERVKAGDSDVVAAHEDIMHPLTARDRGNATQFAPWMKARLEEWKN